MKQYTTSTHLTRTIHQLEHILAGETYPTIQAAEVMAITLLEPAEVLPKEEEQIRAISDLYDQCADRQYGPLYQRQHTRKE